MLQEELPHHPDGVDVVRRGAGDELGQRTPWPARLRPITCRCRAAKSTCPCWRSGSGSGERRSPELANCCEPLLAQIRWPPGPRRPPPDCVAGLSRPPSCGGWTADARFTRRSSWTSCWVTSGGGVTEGGDASAGIWARQLGLEGLQPAFWVAWRALFRFSCRGPQEIATESHAYSRCDRSQHLLTWTWAALLPLPPLHDRPSGHRRCPRVISQPLRERRPGQRLRQEIGELQVSDVHALGQRSQPRQPERSLEERGRPGDHQEQSGFQPSSTARNALGGTVAVRSDSVIRR